MGKTLIIKGSDFSENAINRVITTVTELYYNPGGQSVPVDVRAEDLTLYDGSVATISSTGIYLRAGGISKFKDCLLTDLIDIGEAKSVIIHSKFKAIGDTAYAWCFYSNAVSAEIEPKLKNDVDGKDDWNTYSIKVPEGAVYLRVALYGGETQYNQFYVKLMTE